MMRYEGEDSRASSRRFTTVLPSPRLIRRAATPHASAHDVFQSRQSRLPQNRAKLTTRMFTSTRRAARRQPQV